jgi:hypothetical protein
MAKSGNYWTCDACGKVDFWGDDWANYGSIAHEETCPQDMISTCSDKCREVATKKIESGEWELPQLKAFAGGFHVLSQRKGY